MKVNLAILLIIIIIDSSCHQIRQVDILQRQIINGWVGQARKVNIPFQRCFKVEPQLSANQQYIDFQPTRVGLNSLKSLSLTALSSHSSVLDQLRSPNSFRHRSLLVFDNYIIVIFAPNVVLIIEESRDGFRIKNKYFLQNLERHDQFKMYKLQDKALLIVFNRNKAYLLSEVEYEDYSLPEISSIIHLQQINKDLEFYAAQTFKGLAHYRLNPQKKTVQLIKRIDGDSLKLQGQLNYIVDLNLLQLSSKNIIYVLDAQMGLLQLSLSGDSPKAKLIVKHRNCESFDTISQQHFVLLCQNQGHTTIVQAYRYLDPKTKQYKYRKIQPIFQANYLNDLHLTEQYFLVYSYHAIHTFWNTEKNRLPQTLETQSQMLVPALETFALHKENELNYLYTIQAGELTKYELKEEKPLLRLKSDVPVDKTFTVYLYGSCADLEGGKAEGGVEACRVTKNIILKVGLEEYPHEQDFNISASIVVILLTVFLLVIWICLKKYKGLEKEARKVLESYQKKRKGHTRAI